MLQPRRGMAEGTSPKDDGIGAFSCLASAGAEIACTQKHQPTLTVCTLLNTVILIWSSPARPTPSATAWSSAGPHGHRGRVDRDDPDGRARGNRDARSESEMAVGWPQRAKALTGPGKPDTPVACTGMPLALSRIFATGTDTELSCRSVPPGHDAATGGDFHPPSSSAGGYDSE